MTLANEALIIESMVRRSEAIRATWPARIRKWGKRGKRSAERIEIDTERLSEALKGLPNRIRKLLGR
jgi:hypothetical protein